MQPQPDFVFHLDEPREQFRAGCVTLRGWITTREPLSDLKLCSHAERSLNHEERPDVRRAFPNFSFATGFRDQVDASDLRDGALHFAFAVGGSARSVIEHLSAPSPTPRWPARCWAKLRRALARLRLRFARSPRSRWKAALSVFLCDVQIARGSDFRREEADRLIALFAEMFPDAFVVQIGANDGLAGDPLAAAFSKTRWRGLLVEPVPHLFQKLVARYRDRPGMRIERAAISTQDGEAPLYRLHTVPGQTPEWFDQLASLDRDVLLKQSGAIPEMESLVVEERVPTVRLDTLLARHGVSQIDFLVIDTEGHDFEILRSVDFARVAPTLLMFEHQHLSAEDKQKAYALLAASGYQFRETPEGDTIAWR